MRLNGLRAIHSAKVTQYLLSDTHPIGAAKAYFFKHVGFSPDDPTALEAALLRHPSDNDVLHSVGTSYGLKSIVSCSILTPDGSNPCIISVWIKPPGSTVHRFVTAYPAS